MLGHSGDTAAYAAPTSELEGLGAKDVGSLISLWSWVRG